MLDFNIRSKGDVSAGRHKFQLFGWKNNQQEKVYIFSFSLKSGCRGTAEEAVASLNFGCWCLLPVSG